MAEHIDEFTWDFHAGGYAWRPWRRQGLPEVLGSVDLLVPAGKGSHEGPPTPTHYHPLKNDTGLFRSFADLAEQFPPNDKESIKDFANAFGLLARRTAEPPASNGQAPGERLDFWRKESRDMSLAVELWDYVRGNDLAALSRCIVWGKDPDGGDRVDYQGDAEEEEDSAFTDSPPDGRREIASARVRPDLLALTGPGDLVLPAQFHLARVVNEQLRRHVAVRMGWDAGRRRPALKYGPDTLLGAMWLQFADAIHAGKDYRRCKVCGRWFEVSLEASRPDRVTCSQACRTKSYRERQVTARRMKADGKSYGQIARALDSDVETVRGWITGRKGG